MDIFIREATSADVPQLENLYVSLDVYHVEAHPQLFREADDPVAVRDVPDLLQSADAILLVAEVDGDIAGLVRAKIIEIGTENPVYLPRRYGYVDDMVVAPAQRGRGVGRALLEGVERWAREQGVDELELTVFEFNEGARALYERAGFVTLHRRMRKTLER